MNDQDKNPGKRNEKDEKLKHLLRVSLSPEISNSPRPEESTIRAYISGNATDEQKNVVRDAMMFSESFADEMLARIEAGKDMEDPELPGQMAKIEVPFDELLSRSDTIVSADRVVPGSNIINIWDKIRDFGRQPVLGFGVAAVLLALIIVPRLGEGPGGGGAVFYMNEYLVTRGEELLKPYTRIQIEEGLEFVDLVVESAFDTTKVISFETTLIMEVDEAPSLLLFEEKTLSYVAVDSVLAYPVLRVDAGLLVPGRFVLNFVPVLSGGEPREDLSKEGRFEIVE